MTDNHPLEYQDEFAEPGELTEIEPDWLGMARDAYHESNSFLDKGLRKRWEMNLALANSKHPAGSKYLSDSYKHRSKIFRGKTNAAIRKNIAAAAVALFGTQDVVSVEPEDDNNTAQTEAAEAGHDLVNYHMENSVPWFLICMGAYRDCQVIGTVISHQYWDYDTVTVDDGFIAASKKVVDRPVVELRPIENVRFSPHADWLDPINSSPYLIDLVPMFVGDIKARMEDDWLPYTDAEILSAMDADHGVESVRTARDRDSDPKDEQTSVNEFDVAWVRRVFIRYGGEEWVYYTIGEHILLSQPVPLETAFPHCKDGRRPYTAGFCDVEPHVVYKTGLPERVEGSQVQANDVANLRFDNIQKALRKKWIAERNKNTDFKSLWSEVPGQITITDDINSIKELTTNDVTGSSYQEQHLVNADFDELAGTFSGASVNTNRQLNETVGGMKLLSENANVLTELQLRIFTETWVEPVLRDVLKMVQTYEDDEMIQQVSGKQMTRAQLDCGIKLRVNVGFGATDPQAKVQKLMMGLTTLAQVFGPERIQQMNHAEISAEIFGALGYKDGKRFMPEEEGNAQVEQLQQQLQQLQQVIQQKQIEGKIQLQKQQMGDQTKLEIEKLRRETEMMKLSQATGMKVADIKKEFELKQWDIAGKRTEKADDLKAKLHLQEPGYWPG